MHVKATETYLIIYVLLEDCKWLNVGEQKIMHGLNDQNLENRLNILKGHYHQKCISYVQLGLKLHEESMTGFKILGELIWCCY